MKKTLVGLGEGGRLKEKATGMEMDLGRVQKDLKGPLLLDLIG